MFDNSNHQIIITHIRLCAALITPNQKPSNHHKKPWWANDEQMMSNKKQGASPQPSVVPWPGAHCRPALPWDFPTPQFERRSQWSCHWNQYLSCQHRVLVGLTEKCYDTTGEVVKPTNGECVASISCTDSQNPASTFWNWIARDISILHQNTCRSVFLCLCVVGIAKSKLPLAYLWAANLGNGKVVFQETCSSYSCGYK